MSRDIDLAADFLRQCALAASTVNGVTVEPGSSLVGFKPLKSDALAVHPEQVEEARESAKKKGVPVEFLPDGRPVFTSSRQFREYAKKYGWRHRGY